jgi:two-component system response regulator FixJ
MAGNPVVHVIDDDDAARDALAFLLRTDNFSVHAYDSAKAFLSALPVAEEGCVVTDVKMPEMTGLELLRRLKGMGNSWQ